jgi:predicted HAD superfamily phosphohydrolase YqeG
MLPGAHILAGFSLGFRHRRHLARILEETSGRCTALSLDPRKLKNDGIAVLALDFDGVLSPHGSGAPLPEAREWLDRCVTVFGEQNIFILSNKPTEERRLWFKQHFPAMRFIGSVRKKPFPDGLKKIGELAEVPSSSILMVDDRLLTGCLAAILAGARPAYIRSPSISFHRRPLAELFFMLLRSAERVFVRMTRLFPDSTS